MRWAADTVELAWHSMALKTYFPHAHAWHNQLIIEQVLNPGLNMRVLYITNGIYNIHDEMNIWLLCTLLIIKDSVRNHSMGNHLDPPPPPPHTHTVRRPDSDCQIKDNLCHHRPKTFETVRERKKSGAAESRPLSVGVVAQWQSAGGLSQRPWVRFPVAPHFFLPLCHFKVFGR